MSVHSRTQTTSMTTTQDISRVAGIMATSFSTTEAMVMEAMSVKCESVFVELLECVEVFETTAFSEQFGEQVQEQFQSKRQVLGS